MNSNLNIINLTFIGDPIARQSPRFFYKKGELSIIDPQSLVLRSLKIQVIQQLPRGYNIWKKSEAVVVFIDCYFKIPKSWTKHKKNLAVNNYIFHNHKPDCDNIAKLYLDAIKGIVFEDDAQVVSLMVDKSYNFFPHVDIHCQKEGDINA